MLPPNAVLDCHSVVMSHCAKPGSAGFTVSKAEVNDNLAKGRKLMPPSITTVTETSFYPRLMSNTVIREEQIYVSFYYKHNRIAVSSLFQFVVKELYPPTVIQLRTDHRTRSSAVHCAELEARIKSGLMHSEDFFFFFAKSS